MLAKGIVQRAEALGSVRFFLFFHSRSNRARLGPITSVPRLSTDCARALPQGKAAITPLYDLLTRFAPDISHLTPIHPIFVTVSNASGVIHYPI
jgi:hypothetical protein